MQTTAEYLENLPNGFSKRQIASAITSKRLELTILPTEKCNFRCTYCYEDFLVGKMPNHIQEGIEMLLSHRAPELSELSLSWFGGEPLLALSVIRRISAHAKKLSEEFGFRLMGGLTTNGYTLTEPVLRELVELKQDFYQISLDGWQAVHDETRRRADGAGTFERIWENLIAARKTDLPFEILLRIHVTPTNFESLQTLCAHIGREFGNDQRFRYHFQDIRNLGGDNGGSIVGVSPRTFKQQVTLLERVVKHFSSPLDGPIEPAIAALISEIDAEAEITRATKLAESESTAAKQADAAASPAEQTDTQFTNSEELSGESAAGRRAYDLSVGEPYICYASKPNHFLIRADGRVGKCTVALDHVGNNLGYISPGGELSIDQDKARHWFIGFQDLDVNLMGCPLGYVASVYREKEKSTAKEISIEVVA